MYHMYIHNICTYVYAVQVYLLRSLVLRWRLTMITYVETHPIRERKKRVSCIPPHRRWFSISEHIYIYIYIYMYVYVYIYKRYIHIIRT